ncbi:hypothetical protein U0070_023657, partial [Myodes glareolus]
GHFPFCSFVVWGLNQGPPTCEGRALLAFLSGTAYSVQCGAPLFCYLCGKAGVWLLFCEFLSDLYTTSSDSFSPQSQLHRRRKQRRRGSSGPCSSELPVRTWRFLLRSWSMF